jgi:peptidoglycan hydrolase-like protein with peptidoglycan-binding domain
MRVVVAFLAVVLGSGLAFGQADPEPAAAAKPAAAKPATVKPATVKPAAVKPKPKPKSKPAPVARAAAPATTGSAGGDATVTAKQSVKDSYAAIPLAERYAIQSDLVWTGDYNGLIDGEFSDRLVAAVKAFQKRNKTKDTGVLNPQERAALTASAKPLQDEVGWRLVADPVTGARLGLPGKLATETRPNNSGTHWASAQGQLQIETFRIADARLAAVFEQQKREPFGRRPGYNVLRPDFFVISGTQGLKKFYVRAAAKDNEVRGITILYDQAMEGTMDPIVVAMSSAFVPFASGLGSAELDGAQPRRRVEYGTGLVVSGAGHIVTDKQAIDGCNVIVVPGLGHAERIAEDKTGDLALLRVYGAHNLVPIGLLGAAPRGDTLTLVGVADPQTQAGGGAISAVVAKLGAAASPRPLEAAPALGFSGAAAIDNQGRFFGAVILKTSVVAGPASQPQAIVVPLDRVMNFLEANYVAPASGRAGVEAARESVVRVICVRK